jgi:hypothetical protein
MIREQNVHQGKAKGIREHLIEKKKEVCKELNIPFNQTTNATLKKKKTKKIKENG